MTFEEHQAHAIAEAFWQAAASDGRPSERWRYDTPRHREVWLQCARASIQAAREFKARKVAA
jgi:hypothetical protein